MRRNMRMLLLALGYHVNFLFACDSVLRMFQDAVQCLYN